MRGGALSCVVAVGVVACQNAGAFVCNDDGDCGGAGICEGVGACSFPDPDCPSGRRFGKASMPSIAGECTQAEGTSGPPPMTTSSTSSDDTSGEDTMQVDPGDSSSTGVESGCPPDWWDCTWSRRRRLSFREVPLTPLTDVPVLVLLGPQRIDYTAVQTDAEDLRFVSSTGTELALDVERWDPSGVSAAWVSVPEISADADHFWMYYDNPVAQGAPDGSAVWGGPFVAVWHLGADYRDATGNGNDATPVGEPALAQGQVLDGVEMTTTTSRLDVAASPTAGDLFFGGGTITAWMRPRGWGQNDFGRIADKESSQMGWLLFVEPVGQINFYHWAEGGDQGQWTTAEGSFELGRWYHVAVTWDSTGTVGPTIYIDGFPYPFKDPLPGPVNSDAEVPLTLGNRPNNTRRFEGMLDEVRFARTLRSAEWIELQNLSARDELLTFEAEEDVAP